MDGLMWQTADADESDKPQNPNLVLSKINEGFKRIFCRKATVTPVDGEAFVLQAGSDYKGTCIMPRIHVLSKKVDGQIYFDEYIVLVQEMYYDVPAMEKEGDLYDADLMLVFSYMYDGLMLANEITTQLDTPSLFNNTQELAQCSEIQKQASSVDLVRGAISVAWSSKPEPGAIFFCHRQLVDNRLVYIPALEPPKASCTDICVWSPNKGGLLY